MTASALCSWASRRLRTTWSAVAGPMAPSMSISQTSVGVTERAVTSSRRFSMGYPGVLPRWRIAALSALSVGEEARFRHAGVGVMPITAGAVMGRGKPVAGSAVGALLPFAGFAAAIACDTVEPGNGGDAVGLGHGGVVEGGAREIAQV